MKLIKEMLELIEAQQEWIMAVPKETAAKFPVMPGFDGDWADDIRARAKIVVQHTTDTPLCVAEHANEVAELYREVGKEMVKTTTTVWHMDEWLAIPAIWQSVANERNRLQAQVVALKAEINALKGNRE